MKILNLPFFRKSLKNTRNHAHKHESAEPFHSVRIEFLQSQACNAVRALEDKIYLSADAPRIPLDSCDFAKDCRCRYRHLKDRRRGPRRYSDIGFKALPFIYERRIHNDRRSSNRLGSANNVV